MKTFTKNTLTTLFTQVLILIIGTTLSVILARALGPEGKGIYTLATLLPSLLIVITNLGLSQSTIYHVAKKAFDQREVLGNNVILSLLVGTVSLIIGFFVIVFFKEAILPGLPTQYALLALLIIPLTLLGDNLKNIFLGMQQIPKLNISELGKNSTSLILIAFALLIIQGGVQGVILASISALAITSISLLYWLYKFLNGISFRLNHSYIRSSLTYGVQTHVGNILGYLNYRSDLFLVNFFLNPQAVGFYSISVNIAEKLWLASRATSTVLLPKIAAEKNEEVKKKLTPIVSRTVLYITSLGAIVLGLLIPTLILVLYSAEFLPAVASLQLLLPGIVLSSASRILTNDIAARGKPLLNSYVSLGALAINLSLNIIWIPKFGINGAALATTVSYSATYLSRAIIYSKISGNSLIDLVLIRKSDLTLYKKLLEALINWFRKNLK